MMKEDVSTAAIIDTFSTVVTGYRYLTGYWIFFEKAYKWYKMHHKFSTVQILIWKSKFKKKNFSMKSSLSSM